MNPIIALLLGLALLFYGGELLVKGSVALALRMRVSTFVIGLTIGLIGTISGTLLGIIITENLELIKNFFENLLDTDLFSEEIYFLSICTLII